MNKQIKKYNFIDLCSGIGAGRLGFDLNGFNCVSHSEIDPIADEVYIKIFNDQNNLNDLMKIDISNLPNFDCIVAGFPCQTFSIVGKREGFQDDRGKIINGIIKILEYKKPYFFLFENVKGLVSHNNGYTLKTILDLLKIQGYHVEYKVLNSIDYGVPQLRERIYFIGIRQDIYKNNFDWPKKYEGDYKLSDFLDPENNNILDINNKTFNKYINNKYNKGKFSIQDLLTKEYLVIDTRQSDLRTYENRVPTLRYGRHGILYIRNGKLIKLNSYEAFRLQGFSIEQANTIKGLKISSTKLLSLAGNAMTVNVISELANKIKNYQINE